MRIVRRAAAAAFVTPALLAGSIALVPAPALAACAKPAAPAVKATWGSSGGPVLTARKASKGAAATGLAWTVSAFDGSSETWGPFAAWKRVAANATVRYQPPLDAAHARVSFVAVARNQCGSSAQARITVPVRPASELPLQPTIATALPLTLGKVPFAALGDGAEELPVGITTSTPAVCKPDAGQRVIALLAAGECVLRVSGRTASLALPQPDATLRLAILPPAKPLPVAAQDRPDDLSGFQVHVVYVVPKDAVSHDYQASGHIDTWVAIAQQWLQQRLGRTLRFDTHQGRLDVTVMPSTHTVAQLAAQDESGRGPLQMLAAEYRTANGGGWAGKSLLFIVDGQLSTQYCGLGEVGDDLALVTPVGEGCWTDDADYLGTGFGVNWISSTIVHEVFHNFGVRHSCLDNTDLMLGEGCPSGVPQGIVSIDAAGTQYRGGAAAGVDVLALRVWADGSGTRHPALPGVCFVGQVCTLERTWWSSGEQVLEVQQWVGGAWVTRASFTSRPDPSGPGPFTYDATITPTATGSLTLRYRLVPSATWMEFVGEPFTVAVPY